MPWDRWLNNEYGQKLDDIKSACRRLYDANQGAHGNLPYFTPHGPEHSIAVENLIHMIIPDDIINVDGNKNEEKLNLIERFLLLASAWVHDLGMLPHVFRRVYPTKSMPDEFEIRKQHQRTSEIFIAQFWAELTLDERLKGALGKLARYHRRIETIDPDDDCFYINLDRINLKLLAAYLRLADSLDISSTRAPALPYSVCLAYDMPEESRFHWVKSRLVSSAYPLPEQRKIVVQFKYPYESQLAEFMDKELARESFDSIKQRVVADLNDELSGISNVLVLAGFAYYLDIEQTRREEMFDPRMLNDLKAILANLDIMMAPSATKLLEITLVSVANIMGFSPSKDAGPFFFEYNLPTDIAKLKDEVERFLVNVGKKVFENRPCHIGLINLTEQCKEHVKALDTDKPETLRQCADKINEIYQQHHNARKQIRVNTEELFNTKLKIYLQNQKINILLYGYSELVAKSLCGLRDYLIRETHKRDPREIYNSVEEKSASDRIHLFVCEGQPKTQIANNERLAYHDGSQYALHLRRHGFTNITIIPDIIAGTVVKTGQINLLFLGANGVTNKHFMHAAGHEALVALAENGVNRNSTDALKIILVATKEKVMPSDNVEERHFAADNHLIESDSRLFSTLKGCSENRDNIWLCQDKVHFAKIHANGISFLNPREDIVGIDRINYIVSDRGYVEITPQNADTVIKEHFSL